MSCMTISTCRSTVSTRWFSCKQPSTECLFHPLITETPNLDTCYLTLLHHWWERTDGLHYRSRRTNVIDVQEASPVIKSTDGKEQMKPNHFVSLLPDISDPHTLIPVIESTDVKEQMEVGDDITEVEEEVSPDIIEQIKVHSNVIDVQEANPVIKSTDGKEQMDYITEVEEQTTTDDMEVCISLFFIKLTHLYSQLGPHQKFTCTPTNYSNVHVKMRFIDIFLCIINNRKYINVISLC